MGDRIIPVAKITSEQVEGMNGHCAWAAAGRRHFDGWTCYAAPDKRDQLLRQLADEGYFWLLVEQGGLVQWQLRVSGALFFGEHSPVEFADPVHPAPVYPVCTLVVYASARREVIPAAELRRPDGGPFRPQARGGRYFAYVLFEPRMAEW